MGDNLGAHFIGGFVENFTTENFCRFCDISKSVFLELPHLCGVKRTEESYDNALMVLDNNPMLKNYLCIKAVSPFHQLPGFHVCRPSLPPCIGHDLFEGVIVYDLALIIKHLVKKKWFSYDTLNKRILQFNYVAHDRNDRPPPVAINAKKLGGQAAENWCLLRLFSLIIFGLVKDPKDKVWKLYLTLKDIVDLVCAYEISHQQLTYLDALCQDYVDRRKKHFPCVKLRPKHHFMMHYAALTMQFGPLIRLWTLRMESKHSYFKRCTRVTRCFKNITLTLATKHQLYQAYRCMGLQHSTDVELFSANPLQSSEYSPSAIQELQSCNLLENSVSATSAKYLGMRYGCGMVVVTSESTQIKFCQIKAIILNSNILYFLVQKYMSSFVFEHRLYELTECTNSFRCLKVTDLLDFYPLSCYIIDGKNFVVLKHTFLDNSVL